MIKLTFDQGRVLNDINARPPDNRAKPRAEKIQIQHVHTTDGETKELHFKSTSDNNNKIHSKIAHSFSSQLLVITIVRDV